MVGNYFVYSAGRAVSPVAKLVFHEKFLSPFGFVSLEKFAIGMPFGLASNAQERHAFLNAQFMFLKAGTVEANAS
jgi:hypothetical protein